MVLFDKFEAVKFKEENKIFVTRGRSLYYIYDMKSKHWHKYKNAGNDYITVENYGEVTREEIVNTMGGIFPGKETDFLRRIGSSQLNIRDMMNILKEDYNEYMTVGNIPLAVHRLLLESDISYMSYEKLRKLFDAAKAENSSSEKVFRDVYLLALDILGRDMFKPEIKIVDGHDSSSYFWIQPVRVIDYTNTNDIDSVAEMSSAEISIEEDDVEQYLTPFLFKYFDSELDANRRRFDYCCTDDEGIDEMEYVDDFEWYLTHNFYAFDSIRSIINDLNDTIDALSTGRETEYTKELKIKRGSETRPLVSSRPMGQEEIDEYNRNRPTVDDTPAEMIIDFYKRLIYRLEYMLKVGEEKGYNLISVMGS